MNILIRASKSLIRPLEALCNTLIIPYKERIRKIIKIIKIKNKKQQERKIFSYTENLELILDIKSVNINF